MQTRVLGSTGLEVLPVCVGGTELADLTKFAAFGYAVPEAQSLDTLRAVFASPLNFLDTAANYGNGESERRIGLALAERGGLPSGFVLATKADRDPETRDFTADQTRRSVERSLRLLGLDRLQLVYLHDPEHAAQSFAELTGPDGAVAALHALKAEGVIDHVGIASGPTDLLIDFVKTGQFEVVISHNRFTLLNREAEPLFEVAARHATAVVNAAPYGGGLLVRGPAAATHYMYRPASAGLLDQARRMSAACDRYAVPLAAAALQFSLRDPRVSSTIVGFSRPERVAQTLQLAELPIPEPLWGELDDIYQSGSRVSRDE
jgi:D-threo-aldose 1-dehydrogenase